MRKLVLVLAALLALGLSARADNFNALLISQTGASFLVDTRGMATATVTLGGSGSGLSFTFQGSNAGSANLTTLAACTPGNAPSTSAQTAAGTYLVAVAGWSQLYVSLTALTGTEIFTVNASPGGAGFACGLGTD